MDIMLQGLDLLVAGMLITFLFLMLLVYVVNLAAKIIPRFNHILPDDEPKKKARPAAKHHDDHTAIAVAVAAVHAK